MPDANQVRVAAREAVAEMTGKKVRDGDSLISSGLIDSLAIQKLIAKLETKLRVTMPLDNLQPDDFENVDTIVDTVERTAEGV